MLVDFMAFCLYCYHSSFISCIRQPLQQGIECLSVPRFLRMSCVESANVRLHMISLHNCESPKAFPQMGGKAKKSVLTPGHSCRINQFGKLYSTCASVPKQNFSQSLLLG